MNLKLSDPKQIRRRRGPRIPRSVPCIIHVSLPGGPARFRRSWCPAQRPWDVVPVTYRSCVVLRVRPPLASATFYFFTNNIHTGLSCVSIPRLKVSHRLDLKRRPHEIDLKAMTGPFDRRLAY